MRKVFLCAIFFLAKGLCLGQSKPIVLNDQAIKLQAFLDRTILEKVYFSFDKPYYAIGDTIYFKASVTTGEKNKLSPYSGVLHADLINPQNKLSRSIKLQLKDGIAWGDFALADSLVAGNYRVRGYTNLMHNYGNDACFERMIPVAAITPDKMSVVKSSLKISKPDIQFFPEGGGLVADVKSRVAFKAINENGLGININGTILNSSGQIVAAFTTAHAGMGSFSITPVPGESYRAECNLPDGSKNTILLPPASLNGIAMGVADSGSNISVYLHPSKSYFQQNRDQTFGLCIYSGGKLTTVSSVMDGEDMRFDIQKKGLHSGITQITLFSANGEPLCERLVFINNDDRLKITVTSDRMSYKTREKAQISIHAEDMDGLPVTGHFSIAVTDQSKVFIDPDKEENIFTYLLLTSNLNGHIQEPGYYFNLIDNKKRSDLDLVMLTHGYRRFTWKAVMENKMASFNYQMEKALSISGVANSIRGKALEKGTVNLIKSSGGDLLTETTGKYGEFKFDNLKFYDTTYFFINAVNSKGGNDTKIVYKPDTLLKMASLPFYTMIDTSYNKAIRSYIESSKQRHDEYLKYGKREGIILSEVKIQGVRKVKYVTQSYAGAGNADQVLEFENVTAGGSLTDYLSGRLNGVVFNGSGPHLKLSEMVPGNRPMLVIIDGIQGADMSVLNIIDVERIEVLRFASAAIYGMQGAGGVLIITTKKGKGLELKDIPSRGVLALKLEGFYKAREFYAPVYGSDNENRRLDMRTTIFWLPEIETDKKGNANFSFYNSDNTGNMQIKLEGLTTGGDTGVAGLSYTVK